MIVPLAISNAAHLAELRDGASRFDPRVLHVCLVAPFDVVRERLRGRGRDAGEWELRRARECCGVHGDARFAVQVDARREVPAIVDEVLSRI